MPLCFRCARPGLPLELHPQLLHFHSNTPLTPGVGSGTGALGANAPEKQSMTTSSLRTLVVVCIARLGSRIVCCSMRGEGGSRTYWEQFANCQNIIFV